MAALGAAFQSPRYWKQLWTFYALAWLRESLVHWLFRFGVWFVVNRGIMISLGYRSGWSLRRLIYFVCLCLVELLSWVSDKIFASSQAMLALLGYHWWVPWWGWHCETGTRLTNLDRKERRTWQWVHSKIRNNLYPQLRETRLHMVDEKYWITLLIRQRGQNYSS